MGNLFDTAVEVLFGYIGSNGAYGADAVTEKSPGIISLARLVCKIGLLYKKFKNITSCTV